MRNLLLRSCVIGLLLPAGLMAAKLTLNDGTVYEGTIKKLGSSYSVKLADGTMKLVSAAEVKSVDDPALATPTSPGISTPGAAKPGLPAGPAGADFARTQSQADKVETPLLAVALWQKYVDNHPAAPDLPQAKAELKRWQDWAKDGAEKVKGKWVAGDELKKLHAQVDKMMNEAVTLMQGEQTKKGVDKLQDVLKIYPNSFPANFEMGYFYLIKISGLQGSNDLIDKSIASLETAVRLKPNSPEALSNLAIAYNFRRRYEDAVLTAYKAAQIKDTPEIVQNLVNTLSYAPPGMRANNPKVKPVVEDARLLASRRGIGGASGRWTYVRPERDEGRHGGGDDEGPGALARKGVIGSGTGFFISDSGYVMTNRHVAAGADKMIVVMSDGTLRPAEKVVVDDEQDIAVLKIDAKTPLPFIKLAAYDEPPVGTDVTVMGFPLGYAMGGHVKITRGVVTSIEDGKQECDVIVDAQVNPGNSGGPMLDKNGNLMALVAMKTLSDEKISSYGLGISRGRLRKFFEHQKDKLSGFAPKMTDGEKAAAALSTEDIAQKFTQATVMILMVAGEMPEGLK